MMCLLLLGVGATSVYAQQQQRKDTLVVARDGTGEYRNIQEAVEACLLYTSIFTCHTPDKHVVACSGSSVDRPFR